MSALLSATHVAKYFGGVHALEDASVEVRPGQIAGLIGRNGSGKTTLFNCITGFIEPSRGTVMVDGADVTGHAAQQLVAAGVARTFQTPRVDARVTVREAVLSGCYTYGKASLLGSLLPTPAALSEERQLVQRAEALLAQLDLQALADQEVGKLSMGLVRMVEVARGMAAGARYLLLDEPAAGLSGYEQEVLARQIRAVAASGVGVLLVEHNFPLVRALCDTVTVLDFGSVLSAGTPDEVARDPKVVESYLGAIGEETEVAA